MKHCVKIKHENPCHTIWKKGSGNEVEAYEKISRNFFNRYGSKKLLGDWFSVVFEHGLPEQKEQADPSDRFDRVLAFCGYKNDPSGFFDHVFNQMFNPDQKQVIVNGLNLPVLYLYELLSVCFPADSVYQIKTVNQLEKTAYIRVKDNNKLQQVMDLFPVRLSNHVIAQSMVSDGVAGQYLPFEQELDDTGHDITFDGHFKNGLLEQMYQNRVVFLLDMHCPVYCRFCFRKHKSDRKNELVTGKDICAAVDHVEAHSDIKEILITGGEPLINRPHLEQAVDALMKIDHVKTIRIATRSIAYYPALFLENSRSRSYLKYLIQKNKECLAENKRIEIGIHLVHPDEISIQTLDIISSLVKNGIQVYLQTPFLKGLNTKGKTLARLFVLLRQAGVKIYYIFAPCSPIHGTKEYWAPISQAFEAARYMRQTVSDRCMPKLCTATPLGKIEWQSSGWAVEKDAADQRYTWIRTPYTKAYFEQFLSGPGSGLDQMPAFRVNPEGTLDARFRVDMGEECLYVGNRPEDKRILEKIEPEILQKRKNWVESWFKDVCFSRQAIEAAESKYISRFHRTCVELDINADPAALRYIEQHGEITDVVLCCPSERIGSFDKINALVMQLKQMDHIICVRLCFKALSLHPDIFNDRWLEKMAAWSDFSIGNPFRIEVETWVMLPEKIAPGLGQVARNLTQSGINIYANSVLMGNLNDQPGIMVNLAHKLRDAQIEFHHLYVSGTAFQREFEKKFKTCRVDDQSVLDIASRIRTDCSGREIPLYIIQTETGERDYDFSGRKIFD